MHHFRKGCLLLGALLSYVFTFPSHFTTSIDNYFYCMFVSKKLRVSREYRELPKESKANRNTSCGHSNVPVIGMKIQTQHKETFLYIKCQHLSGSTWVFCLLLGCFFYWGLKIHYFLTKKRGAWSCLAQTLPLQHPLSPFPPPFPRRRFHSSAVVFHELLLFCFPLTRAQLMLFIEGEKTNELSWLVQTNFLRNISL